MTGSEQARIRKLEERLVLLEARLAALEAKQVTVVYGPSVPAHAPTPTPSCPYCHLPLSLCRGHNICVSAQA